MINLIYQGSNITFGIRKDNMPFLPVYEWVCVLHRHYLCITEDMLPNVPNLA